MFHYGTEKENYSNSTQEVISRFAIDSGADIVVGSHPHVIQGIEEYNEKLFVIVLEISALPHWKGRKPIGC